LEILAEHKLFLRLEKCKFHRSQIKYLRLVILENKVEMDPVKVARVVRATGHKTPGESSVVLQIVVRVQLTSRGILRD